jgi:hypothetical protein
MKTLPIHDLQRQLGLISCIKFRENPWTHANVAALSIRFCCSTGIEAQKVLKVDEIAGEEVRNFRSVGSGPPCMKKDQILVTATAKITSVIQSRRDHPATNQYHMRRDAND